ncbi:MAG: hypothetical protein II966_01370 [Lachnospiraceae bacterium]|nr:hypothetical protein [Lachnospiraceae bacterium]
MDRDVISEKTDLTHLRWAHTRHSSGTAGTYLKSEESEGGKKIYYKLSDFDSEKGIIGHECINEIIVDRLLGILGVEHLKYRLIHADVDIEGTVYDTWLCASGDFKEKGESKAALDDYYQINAPKGQSRYEFCKEQGWQKYIDTMLAVDYLILNRDRHGANIEVLRNARKRTLRIAPLFDHGLSLLCSCHSIEEIKTFDVMLDRPCNNYIGSRSTLDNLEMIKDKKSIFHGRLALSDKDALFTGLNEALPEVHLNKIWEMLYERWCRYEDICNS